MTLYAADYSPYKKIKKWNWVRSLKNQKSATEIAISASLYLTRPYFKKKLPHITYIAHVKKPIFDENM